MFNLHFVFIGLLLLILPNPANAQTSYWEEMMTNIRISVLAKDGTFIGTDMGGVHITVKNKRTGDVLAEGITYGSKGKSDIIMKGDRSRDSEIVDFYSASYKFGLDITKPTPVTITATGPLTQSQNPLSTSQDFLLIPGKDYESGNGIILELPGLAVDILSPATHSKGHSGKESEVTLLANVVKLSGDNIEDGSYWPPENYQVEAAIYMNGVFLKIMPLKFVKSSTFMGKLSFTEPGSYNITVTAYDPKTKESGIDNTTIIVTEPTTEK
jgi:hypothetical protein